MYLRFKLVFAAALALAFMPARAATAAPQDDLKSVLDRLNVSAANFHSASAEVEYDTIETDPVKARALGREELSRYMVLDNYRNAWLGMGFTEADLSNGGSDGFIDQMMLWGTADQVKAKLRAHFDAGATHVAIQPLHAAGDTAGRDAILAALVDT